MKAALVLGVLLFLGNSALASSTQPLFDQLKSEPVDYTPTGQICEQVARLELADKYLPGEFDIAVGVEYSVAGRTIGELDIVITERKSNQVALVGEVKCWKDVGAGLTKALQQRQRFVRTLAEKGGQIKFNSKEGKPFGAQQFQSPQYVAIAQAGSQTQGFDLELGHDLRELMSLRGELLDCQAQGKCPVP